MDEAEDADEADEESSSGEGSGSGGTVSVSSSSSSLRSRRPLGGLGGSKGKPASLALAKDRCSSLMVEIELDGWTLEMIGAERMFSIQ